MVDLNWASIGVCWVLTTVTVIILYVAWKGIQRLRNKRRKERNNLPKEKEKTNGVSDPLIKEKVPDKTTESTSTPIILPTTAPQLNGRRKQDDVSRWCSDHDLPENLVYILRDQGFTSKAALDALRPEDLAGSPECPPVFKLPNSALRVQLRQELVKIHGSRLPTDLSSHSELSECSSTTKPGFRKPYSRGDSGIASYHQTSATSTSGEVFYPEEDEPASVDGRIKRQQSPKKTGPKSRVDQRFHGLLSDEGLWQITKMTGHEWRHLASLLNISTQTQERLMESYRHNVQGAIHEILTTWRNDAVGTKEELKGQLHNALVQVGRKDIANKLMYEQIHGSNDKVNKTITSII